MSDQEIESTVPLRWPIDDNEKTNLKDDQLGHDAFAKRIAKILEERVFDGPTCIGITGKWGAGKSSIAKFLREVCQDLTSTTGERPLSKIKFSDFNPWQSISDASVEEEFYKLLASHVPESIGTKFINWIQKHVIQILSCVLVLLVTCGSIYDLYFQKQTNWLAPTTWLALLTAVPAVYEKLKPSVDALSKAFNLPKEDSLAEKLSKVKKKFSTLKEPVVIIVDDIDRLNHERVFLLFQLLNNFRDFQNLNFILLYDRDEVNHSLEKYYDNKSSFIDKIVTLEYPITQHVVKSPGAVLGEYLQDLGKKYNLNDSQIADSLSFASSSLGLGFENVRQVKRFANSLFYVMEAMQSKGYLEIEFDDLIALEYLNRFHQPAIDYFKWGTLSRYLFLFKPWDETKSARFFADLKNSKEEYLKTLSFTNKLSVERCSYQLKGEHNSHHDEMAISLGHNHTAVAYFSLDPNLKIYTAAELEEFKRKLNAGNLSQEDFGNDQYLAILYSPEMRNFDLSESAYSTVLRQVSEYSENDYFDESKHWQSVSTGSLASSLIEAFPQHQNISFAIAVEQVQKRNNIRLLAQYGQLEYLGELRALLTETAKKEVTTLVEEFFKKALEESPSKSSNLLIKQWNLCLVALPQKEGHPLLYLTLQDKKLFERYMSCEVWEAEFPSWKYPRKELSSTVRKAIVERFASMGKSEEAQAFLEVLTDWDLRNPFHPNES